MAQTYPIELAPSSSSSPRRRSACVGMTHAMNATVHAPHIKPFINESETLMSGPARSSITTIATSVAMAHQYATESGSDAVLLHSKLQQEKPRKSSAHRTLGSFVISQNGYRTSPTE